jgi:putative nucleotide binding protein
LSYPRRRVYYPEKRYEPSLYVLDYLEMGNPSDIHYEHRNQPFVQGIGTKYFSLLEATPLIGVKVEILEKVDLSYPSKLRRIIHISYNELTSMSRTNLPEAIRRVLYENEKVFVEFFNIAEPINIRLHSLELLPDVGKKTMNAILDARRQRKFTSFDDIKERVGIDPVKALIDRIIKELVGGEKYYLFIRPRDKGAVYLGYLERLYGEAF